MLVNTTLVRALNFSARLVTACPQLWKATRAMGTNTFQVMSSFTVADLGPQVRIEAAPMISDIWMRNEAQRTHLRLGEKKR